MTDSSAFQFGQFIPGFDFLKNLATAPAGHAAKGLGAWVAPTLNVEELERRITELKAVLFWLDQNSTALKATIQALEVQKMTLATLQGMNVSMADLAKAFTAPASATASPAPAPTAAAASEAGASAWPYASTPASAAPAPAAGPAPQPDPASAPAATSPVSPASLADPMQWWGALTQQFQSIAANALRDVATAMPVPPAAKRRRTTGGGRTRSAAAPTAQPAKKTAKKAAKKPAAASPATSGSRARAGATRQKAAPAAILGWPLPPPLTPPAKKRR
ncbi:MAG: hypothetical protein Q4D74_07485 [Comamonadaceae bacterium]|nr:hypothetical protein [Comamonadaceae bacterium]